MSERLEENGEPQPGPTSVRAELPKHEAPRKRKRSSPRAPKATPTEQRGGRALIAEQSYDHAAVVVEKVPQITAALTANGNQKPELGEIEEHIYRESMGVVSAMLRFADIVPGSTEPPPEWVAAMGEAEAIRCHRIASAAWLPGKDAPVALTSAAKLAVGIAQVRARVPDRNTGVTINMVSMPIIEGTLKRRLVGDGS